MPNRFARWTAVADSSRTRRGCGRTGRVVSGAFPGDTNIRVDAGLLTELENDPWNIVLVAEHERVARGTAALTIGRDVMYGTQPYGLVENVVVHSTVRGLGVGAALLAELEALARMRACTKLMLLSATTRTDAHAFFARRGFDGVKKRGFVKYLNR